MTTNTRHNVAGVLLLLALLIGGTGCGETATLCNTASDHVGACTGQQIQARTTCSAVAESKAVELLEKTCPEIQKELGQRQPQSFFCDWFGWCDDEGDDEGDDRDMWDDQDSDDSDYCREVEDECRDSCGYEPWNDYNGYCISSCVADRGC